MNNDWTRLTLALRKSQSYFGSSNQEQIPSKFDVAAKRNGVIGIDQQRLGIFIRPYRILRYGAATARVRCEFPYHTGWSVTVGSVGLSLCLGKG